MYHLRLQDLIKRVNVAELAVRVVCAVAMVFLGDFRKLLERSAVLVHMFLACVCEQPNCERSLGLSEEHLVSLHESLHGFGAVAPEELEWPAEHFVEPECKHAVSLSAAHCLRRLVQSGAACAPIVVDVEDWNASHADRVDRPLP